MGAVSLSAVKFSVILVAFCCILFAGCVGSGDSSSPPEATTPVPPAESDPQPSETVANTMDVVTLGPDETLTVQNPQVNAQVSVDGVIRGSRADTIVAESDAESNLFSSEPVHGYEYLMVHIRIKNTDDYSLAVSPYFDLPVYVSGVSYNEENLELEGYPVLEPTTLLSNEEIHGWMVYMVPVGESAELAYEPLLPDEPLGFIRLS
ncbi:DUF4352 domain-containing protein [Methanogenium cariaci]|jgi:uncharacterized protein DUF4352